MMIFILMTMLTLMNLGEAFKVDSRVIFILLLPGTSLISIVIMIMIRNMK